MFVFLHPLYTCDISCFCNVTAVWESIENTARKVVSSYYLKTHENFYAKNMRRQKVDKLENRGDRTSYFFTENVAINLESECIVMKDIRLPCSFSLPVPSPSSKQLGQRPRTQPGTQRRAMHSTALHRVISLFSLSSDSLIPLLISNAGSGRGEVRIAAVKIHKASTSHWSW